MSIKVNIFRSFLVVLVAVLANVIDNFVIEEEPPVLDNPLAPYKVVNDFTYPIYLLAVLDQPDPNGRTQSII